MANPSEHSSLRTSSEHALPAAYSASCYDCAEHVCFLPIVMTEGELGQVERQVGLADLVIGADHAPLEQAPKAIQVRGMDVPAHIFTSGMIHGLMRELQLQPGIAGMLIRRHEGHVLADGLPNETAQRHAICVFNNLADYIPFPRNRANDAHFPAADASRMGPLAAMPVLILAPDVGFIYLDFTHELAESAIFHGGSDAMAHIPGSPVVAGPDLAMDLQGTDPLLALRHQVDHLEPDRQGIVGVLENGLRNDGEAVAIASAALFAFAHPMKRLALQSVNFLIRATRALYAVRPAFLGEKLLAGFFGREARHQAAQGHRLLGHDPLRWWREYSLFYRVVSSAT